MNPLDVSLIRELFRITPYLFSTVAVVLFFFIHDTELLFFSIGSFCSGGFNGVLKHFIRSIVPSSPWLNSIINRPPGAVDCSCIIDTNARAASTPLGMPSGHCQSMGFFVGYMWSRVRYQASLYDSDASTASTAGANLDPSNSPQFSPTHTLAHPTLTAVGGIILMAVMAISRLGKDSWLFVGNYLPRGIVADSNGCHTLSQTVLGTLLGLVLGSFWHYMFVVDR